MSNSMRRTIVLLTLAVLGLLRPGECRAAQAAPGKNLLANPSFEYGVDGWRLDKAGKTEARFSVDQAGAAAGKSSAVLKVDNVEEWGTQFGQTLSAPARGKTFTFAAVAQGVGGPAAICLEIERAGRPWDRAARGPKVVVKPGEWTEFHVTFTVDKPFPEGWFAYVSCAQPRAQFRLDMVRLYEGAYLPYRQLAEEETRAAEVAVYDTAASGPVPAEALAKKAGWVKLPEDETAHRFKGGCVVLNDRLALVLRRGAPAVEVLSKGPSGFQSRAAVAPAPGRGWTLSSVRIAENSPDAAAVEALFETPERTAAGLRCELQIGQAFLKTEALAGAKAARLDVPCRYVVLPDFFADDIIADARRIPVPCAELPSENFLLHLAGRGEAVVMSVSNQRSEDVRMTLSGDGEARRFESSETPFGKNGKLWLAVIEGPQAWHEREISKADLGKVVPLEWTSPFPAQWRVDWRRADGLASSWEMILQRPEGDFTKHGWFGSPSTIPKNRQRWTTVLGSFPYPCWIDREGRGHLQPLVRVHQFEGPALVYPINRVKDTPLDRFTVVDVVRSTLGVGPCEYILDVEGQGQTMKGRATCATRDALKEIYAAGRQKQKRAEILRILDDVLVFVKHIRGRIEDYVAFGRETLDYLQREKKAHPERARFIAEMETLARAIDGAVAKRREHIKSPDYVAALTQKFRDTLLDAEGPEALARCREITEAIVVVGGNQDELVGECRLAVKILRQRAALAMAADPASADVAREIRARTQKILRNATSYEAPRQ